MKATFDLLEEPSGEIWQRLLDRSLAVCDFLQLVVHHGQPLDASGQDVLRRLHSFLVSDQEEREWPGTILYGHTARVLRFRYTPESMNILSGAADRLYAWVQPGLPEDLALLREDLSPWLASISHERDAYFELAGGEENWITEQLPELAIQQRTE